MTAKNPAVLGGVPTNISLWFQTLPGVVPNRVAGTDRIGTAVAASQDQFPAGSASAVVLARADEYSDAMVGGPLAAKAGGPVLLTGSSTLAPAALTEIERALGAKSDPIYVLGGTSAIAPAVLSQLSAAGYTNIVRVAGADRYGTAVAVAGQLGNPAATFLATGENVPDALSAGPAVAQAKGAILLTQGTSLGATTKAYLTAHPATSLYAVGIPACQADTVANCVAGQDRYATSMKVAAKFFPATQSLGVATGADFPDALAATPDMASRGGPILLVPSTGTLPASVTTQLGVYLAQGPAVNVYGGDAAVSSSVLDEVVGAADGTS